MQKRSPIEVFGEWDPYKGQNIFEDGFIYFIENSILETFSVMIDSLQNKFRVQRGLPKIGEGWVHFLI